MSACSDEIVRRYRFTHRATGLPGGDPEGDRLVLCNGLRVGRVFRIDDGPQAGSWDWSAMCVGNDTRGNVATLEDGLEEIKSRVTPKALAALPPKRQKPE